MNILALAMLGFAPGIFWLWLIYQRDRYIPAPLNLVVRTFLLGIAVAVPVSIVEAVLIALGGVDLEPQLDTAASPAQAAYVAFVVAGVTEELAKYLVVRRTIFSSPYFRQPLDGIIFASAAALGFASIENVAYMFSYGPEVILVRGPFSTLAHVLFSATWGYSLGAHKRLMVGQHPVTLALLASMVLHGLFDFFLLADPDYWIWALVLFLGIGLLFTLIIKVAQHQSPYRNRVAAIIAICPACMNRTSYGAIFCPACGQSLVSAKRRAALSCSQCRCFVERSHSFCTACGSRLDRKLVISPQLKDGW